MLNSVYDTEFRVFMVHLKYDETLKVLPTH